jgi:hypothetical protein
MACGRYAVLAVAIVGRNEGGITMHSADLGERGVQRIALMICNVPNRNVRFPPT